MWKEDIEKFAPDLRIKHYANILLGLVDEVFNTEDGFHESFDKFAYFMDYFDAAFSNYGSENPEFDKPYDFSGEMIYDQSVLTSRVSEMVRNLWRSLRKRRKRNNRVFCFHGTT